MPGRRITVNLPPSSERALDYLTGVTEDNMTDVMARALRLYELVQKTVESGGKVMIQHPGQMQPQSLYIL